jgi:hypothetical protein
MYNFDKNLERGHFIERIIGGLIESKLKYKVHYNESQELKDLRKCDLGFKDSFGIKRFVEVKSDWYKKDTNNVMFQRSTMTIRNTERRDVGVFSTSAEFFVYMMPLHSKDNLYLCRSKDLKELLMDKYNHCIIFGTENTFSCMYRIDKDDFREDFLKIGKILTYNDYEIPEHFNIKKLN